MRVRAAGRCSSRPDRICGILAVVATHPPCGRPPESPLRHAIHSHPETRRGLAADRRAGRAGAAALGPVLTPFVVAAVLAYALTPLVDRLDERGRGRMPRVLAVIWSNCCSILTLLVALRAADRARPGQGAAADARADARLLFDRLDAHAARPGWRSSASAISLDLASLQARSCCGYLQRQLRATPRLAAVRRSSSAAASP